MLKSITHVEATRGKVTWYASETREGTRVHGDKLARGRCEDATQLRPYPLNRVQEIQQLLFLIFIESIKAIARDFTFTIVSFDRVFDSHCRAIV